MECSIQIYVIRELLEIFIALLFYWVKLPNCVIGKNTDAYGHARIHAYTDPANVCTSDDPRMYRKR